MINEKINNYALTSLRIIIGLMFFMPGLNKLMGLMGQGHMIAQMIGLPLAWILAIAEVIFGMLLVVGYQTRISTIPLSIIMLGAIVLAVIPSFSSDPMAMISLFFHLTTIAALAVLGTGNLGAFALDNRRLQK